MDCITQVFCNLGFHKCMINNTANYEYNGKYHRISLYGDNRCVLLESASHYEDANRNLYEDSDWFDLCDKEGNYYAYDELSNAFQAMLICHYGNSTLNDVMFAKGYRVSDMQSVSIVNFYSCYEKNNYQVSVVYNSEFLTLDITVREKGALNQPLFEKKYPISLGMAFTSCINRDIP